MKFYPSSRANRGTIQKNKVLDSKTRKAAGSLLDRLILDDEDIDVPITHYDVDGVIRSIKRNLSRALNIHAGSASSNLELGIPDFNHSTVSSLEVSMHLVDSIRRCIEMAEPRLRNVEVKSRPDINSPLDLDFAITADLAISNKDEQIRIEIAMRDGHFFPS